MNKQTDEILNRLQNLKPIYEKYMMLAKTKVSTIIAYPFSGET